MPDKHSGGVGSGTMCTQCRRHPVIVGEGPLKGFCHRCQQAVEIGEWVTKQLLAAVERDYRVGVSVDFFSTGHTTEDGLALARQLVVKGAPERFTYFASDNKGTHWMKAKAEYPAIKASTETNIFLPDRRGD